MNLYKGIAYTLNIIYLAFNHPHLRELAPSYFYSTIFRAICKDSIHRFDKLFRTESSPITEYLYRVIKFLIESTRLFLHDYSINISSNARLFFHNYSVRDLLYRARKNFDSAFIVSNTVRVAISWERRVTRSPPRGTTSCGIMLDSVLHLGLVLYIVVFLSIYLYMVLYLVFCSGTPTSCRVYISHTTIYRVP